MRPTIMKNTLTSKQKAFQGINSNKTTGRPDFVAVRLI